MNRQKLIILLTVFIDVVGIGLVLPTLPLYVERFGASPIVATIFFAVYSLFQFFSAPILGAWSDKVGRRPVLIISLFGTALGWFVFALANSLPLLFLGRIIDGITGGNISTAQSYLVDISKTPKERTENLGLIGASFGTGFILGPALGAALSGFGPSVPFWAAGIITLCNSVAALFFLPESHHAKDHTRKVPLNPFAPIWRGLTNPKINLYLISWLLFSLAFTNLQSIFTLFTNRQFQFDGVHSGYLLALIGVIVALNQGFFLKRFWLKHFPEPLLEIAMMIILVFVFIAFSINDFSVFIAALVIFSFASSVLRVVTNSQIAGAAPDNQKGETIGTVQGLTSLAAIIIPPFSGYLFELNISGPWYMASAIMAIAVIFTMAGRKKIQKAALPVNAEPLS